MSNKKSLLHKGLIDLAICGKAFLTRFTLPCDRLHPSAFVEDIFLQISASTMFLTATKAPPIRASKINHKSPILHPMARFVTEEAVALMFGISIDQIERIDCYCYMVYVHAANVSRFVSYADFPPPQTVETVDSYTFYRWRKRWRRRWNSRFAPDWWQQYYIDMLQLSFSDRDLIKWRKVIILIKSALSANAWRQITQTVYFVKVI